MPPWRASALFGEHGGGYSPGWDPTEEEYPHFTPDLSHSATSRVDTMAMLGRMGGRLAHLHPAAAPAPSRTSTRCRDAGAQPCAEVLGLLGRNGFDGHVVLEVNTRRAVGPDARDADLAEALTDARRHLVLGDTAAAGEARQITV